MSREEAKEKEQAELSDKIRLEMALKESAEIAAKVVAKHSSQATTSTEQSSDLWGAPIAQASQNTFDPFSSSTQQSASNGDAWGATPASQTQSFSDPWGSASTAPSAPANVAQPVPFTGDPWGSASTVTSGNPLANNVASADPWNAGNDGNQKPDSWTGSAVELQSSTSTDPWGSNQPVNASTANSVTPNSFDPFSSQSAAQNTDPFKELQQLKIGPAQPTASLDLFSANVLTPLPIGGSDHQNKASDTTAVDNENRTKAGAFLGNNANLVNIDSLVSKPASTHQYLTINNTNLSQVGGSRNPFEQKGPSLSMNQMKSGNQTSFGQPFAGGVSGSAVFPVANPMAVPSATGMSPMLMTGQPGYARPGTMPANPNLMFASQPVQSQSAIQQNQLLF